MSAPFHRILSKTERALVAYLIAQGAGTAATILAGKNSASKTLPISVVWGKHWELDPPHSREFNVDITIAVKCQLALDAGQTGNVNTLASDALLGPIFGSFTEPDPNNVEAIPVAITNAARIAAINDPDNNGDLADFTCLAIMAQSGDSDAVEKEGVWIDTMDLKLRCSPYNVS